MQVNEDRVRAVSEAFSRLGLRGVKLFEDLDPQMDVAKAISSVCGELTPLILYVNALISYMLSMRGEDYWRRFADVVVSHCPSNFNEVIDVVKEFTAAVHRYAVNTKLSRLNSLRRCEYLVNYIQGGDILQLWKYTSRCLGTDPNSKTIVFSIKMLYYGYRALGDDTTLPFDIPIPVDRRVARVTYLAKLVELPGAMGKGLAEVTNTLLRGADVIRRVWSDVGLRSSIPPLHLDAPLWILGRYSNASSRCEVLKFAVSDLGNDAVQIIGYDNLRTLINELYYSLAF